MSSIAENENVNEQLRRKDEEITKLQNELKSIQLSNSDIYRYSRQIILPEIGIPGQLKLKKSKVFVVGGGGLACPAIQYLAAAGVGHIAVADNDKVEETNLHRQILHNEKNIGVFKGDSIAETIKNHHSSIVISPFNCTIDSTNALDILSPYDIILDASDNVATRYLLNDAAVILKKPLVSGSALRFEGQLSVFNYPPDVGTTYRCIHPVPPPPETVTNCSDGGVLGVVTGVIGVLQALETIKIITENEFVTAGKMLLFDAFAGTFRTIILRPRQATAVTKLIDYKEFCGGNAHDKDVCSEQLLEDSFRISVQELQKKLNDEKETLLLLDVRSEHEMTIASISQSKNVPLSKLSKESLPLLTGIETIIVICRRGNDSQKAVINLRSILSSKTDSITIKDVKGGLHAWAKYIDTSMAIY